MSKFKFGPALHALAVVGVTVMFVSYSRGTGDGGEAKGGTVADIKRTVDLLKDQRQEILTFVNHCNNSSVKCSSHYLQASFFVARIEEYIRRTQPEIGLFRVSQDESKDSLQVLEEIESEGDSLSEIGSAHIIKLRSLPNDTRISEVAKSSIGF